MIEDLELARMGVTLQNVEMLKIPGTENKAHSGDQGKWEHFNNCTFGKCMVSSAILQDLIKMQNFALLFFVCFELCC